MNFSQALELIKDFKSVSRSGWNGKSMYVFMDNQPYSMRGIEYLPCIILKTTQGLFQPGWLPSQSDLFANDWVEIKMKD